MKASIIIVLALACLVSSTTADDLSDAWKPDVSGWSFNPSRWNATLKTRMYMVAAGIGYAMSLNQPHAVSASFGLFLFGLVKLNWLLVLSSCTALYGWVKQKRVFLGAGLLSTYALAFGVSIV